MESPEMDRERILLQNYVSFKELGQMTKDVQLPDHVLWEKG